MTLDSALLPVTALLFTVVFAGAGAYYLGGTDAVPGWFFRLKLVPERLQSISPVRRAVGIVTSLAFLALAQWAVVANLDNQAPFGFAVLLSEQVAALAWLGYLGWRLLYVSRRGEQ